MFREKKLLHMNFKRMYSKKDANVKAVSEIYLVANEEAYQPLVTISTKKFSSKTEKKTLCFISFARLNNEIIVIIAIIINPQNPK